MKKTIIAVGLATLATSGVAAQETSGGPTPTPMATPEPLPPPILADWKPLPAKDPKFSEQLAEIVVAVGLDGMTPADKNPDNEDEWATICLVDFSDRASPRVAGWKEDNFIYPASTYKMYCVGEAVRQVVAGEKKLDDVITIKEHNVRSSEGLAAGQQVTLSEILRLTVQHSDNTAANETIDAVDRRRATALMHALGCQGSEITRKYLSRKLEDPGWAEVPSTVSNAHHLATFLWAVETGAIGGGRGRGLMKAYLATDETNTKRFRAGLPPSATMFSKTGTWNIFTCEAAIVEDGDTRYILCAMVPLAADEAEPKMAELASRVHALVKK